MKAWAAIFLALVPGVVGCASDPVDEAAYIAAIEAHRADREARLRESWLTLAGLFWLEPGENAFGSDPSGAIVLPADAAPPRAGAFDLDAETGEVTLRPDPAAGLTVGGAPATTGVLVPDADDQAVGLGRVTMILIERSGAPAIRLRDPQARALSEFDGIDYFPIDDEWVVEGVLEPYEQARELAVATVVGRDTVMTSKGRVRFDLGGRRHELEAFVASDDATELFLLFRDLTTGESTYGSGRYLYAPFARNRVTLDFNKAYNPPCAFTAHATCPLPPRGNTIDAAVEAGERAYHP